MRYAQLRNMDISNGEGVGISLFVQGCHFGCKNCFNPETHNFNGGKEWDKGLQDEFLKLVERPYVKRISILGGEPLATENVDGVLNLVNEMRLSFPEKKIWLYSGYTWEQIFDNHQGEEIGAIFDDRQKIVSKADVFIDGRYVDELRDLTLKFRGSSNQRVIDVQKSIVDGEIVLWTS